MNIEELMRQGINVTVPNPNYNPRSRKNKQPKTIEVPYYGPRSNGIVQGMVDNVQDRWSIPTKDIEKYTEHGLTYNPNDPTMDDQLAEAQSNFEKTRNAFAQTLVSEIGLGTMRGVTDLFDFITHKAFSQDEDNDYSSDASRTIQRWQEEFERNYDVYTRQGSNIANSGLLEWGWYMKNIPSIASSLTLLIPSTGAMKALGYLGKATRATKLIGNTRKFARNLAKLDKAATEGKQLSAFQKGISKLTGTRAANVVNNAVNLGGNAFLSRVMENYQESAQTYDEMLPQATEILANMSDDEYKRWVERNQDVLQDVDTSDREAAARRVAKESADRTFRDDMINAVFDVWQLYALRNLKHFMNAPMRASVRREHLNTIRYPGKTEAEIEEALKNRKFFEKAKDKASDLIYGSRLALGAELNEGVEEAINYIAQQEGLTYGKLLLGQDKVTSFWDQRLPEYMKAPELWESAFWGLMGGITFQQGASGLARARNAITMYNYEKEHARDENTREEKKRPSWREYFMDPEIKSRVTDIKGRILADENVKAALKQINEKHEHPLEPGVKLETEEEREAARDEVFARRTLELLLKSMFVGNYDLTKAYLENEKVMQAFVDAGVISREEAARRRNEVSEIAERLEELYDANLSAIDNAINSKNVTDDDIKYNDVPLEYMQLIAELNIQYQLEADMYAKRISRYNDVATSEEKRLEKELRDKGINYRDAVKFFTIVSQIGQINAEIERLKQRGEHVEGEPDLRTLSGQSVLKELENRKKILLDMLNTDTVDEKGNVVANRLSKLMSVLRYGSATEKRKAGEPGGTYFQNVESDRYRKVDEAITRAFNSDEGSFKENYETLKGVAASYGIDLKGMEDISLEDFKSSMKQADVYTERIAEAIGASGDLHDLNQLSKKLADAYTNISFYETQRLNALSHIAITKNNILDAAYQKHNLQDTIRGGYLDGYLMNGLKQLAKKYTNEENPEDNIIDALAYGSVNKQAREKLKSVMSEGDMALYDELMDCFALNTKHKRIDAYNARIPSLIKEALWQSSYEKYSEVYDETAVEDTLSDMEEEAKESEESSSTSEKPAESKETKRTDTTSSKPTESSSEAEKGKIPNFLVNADGTTRETPRATIKLDDSGKLDSVTPYEKGSEHHVTIKPVAGTTNTFELDYKGELNAEIPLIKIVNSIFTTSLFNKNVPVVDGGTVVKNPIVRLNENGSIADVTPGVIDRVDSPAAAEEESGAEETAEGGTASIPSTGEEADVPEVEGDDGTNKYTREQTFASIMWEEGDTFGDLLVPIVSELRKAREELGDKFDRDTFVDRAFAAIVTNKEYDINFTTVLTKEQFDAIISKVIPIANRRAFKRADSSELQELNNIFEFVSLDATSSATDEELARAGETAHIAALNAAFEAVINDYADHAIVAHDNDGKPVISLENLMKYIINLTGSIAIANKLYDRCVDILTNSGKYRIATKADLNNITDRSVREQVLTDACKNTTETEVKLTGKRINFDRIVTPENKTVIYAVLDSLNPGDKLSVKIADGKRYKLLIKAKGQVIGELAVPMEEGDKYTMIQKGWLYDMPKNLSNIAKIKELFLNTIANPRTEEERAIKEAVQKAVYTKRTYDRKTYNVFYVEAIQNIFKAYKKAGIDLTPFLANYVELNSEGVPVSIEDAFTEIPIGNPNEGVPPNVGVEAGEHLLNIFREIRSGDETYFSKYKMTADEYEDRIKARRAASLERWFAKSEDSYRTARYIYDRLQAGKTVNISVDSVNEGALRIVPPSDAIPVNDPAAIADVHKEHLEIGVSSITEVGTMYSTDPAHNCAPTNMKPGSTFVTIQRKDGSIVEVHAFPRLVSSFTTRNSNTYKIRMAINTRLRKLITDWSNGKVDGKDETKDVTTENIRRFLNTLLLTKKDSVALFKGVTVESINKNPDLGLKLGFKIDGKYQYVFLWNKTSRGTDQSLIDVGYKVRYNATNGEERKKGIDFIIDLLDKSLTYNIAFDHVQGKHNTNGCGIITDTRKFVVVIPGSKTKYEFDSYKDFILGEGIVSVTTKHDGKGSNFKRLDELNGNFFERAMITFKVEGMPTSPVERRNTLDTVSAPDNKALTEDIRKSIIGKATNGVEIIRKLLKGTAFERLSRSSIFRGLDFSNIFINDVPSNEVNVAYTVRSNNKERKGRIYVTEKWFKLIQDGKTDEAFRQLVHESIHRKLQELSKEDKEAFLDKLRPIFDKFVEDNKRDGIMTGRFLPLYDKAGKEIKKYFNGNVINYAGLEEFLVESITRPVLMERLNNIPSNTKIGNKLEAKSSRNLFRDILLAIADLLGIVINKGSLLEKEYNLFKDVFNNVETVKTTAEETVVSSEPSNESESQNEETNNEENNIQQEEPTTTQNEENEELEEDEDDGLFGMDYVDESRSTDDELASTSDILSSIPSDNIGTFYKLLNKGGIIIKC